mmetsp:Transcript_6297/g.26149  ORF Transcript_6297/g.26149 Transcript_6297/m.26149 type:complete len:715 (-) Transcript_6297:1118-3262(-)
MHPGSATLWQMCCRGATSRSSRPKGRQAETVAMHTCSCACAGLTPPVSCTCATRPAGLRCGRAQARCAYPCVRVPSGLTAVQPRFCNGFSCEVGDEFDTWARLQRAEGERVTHAKHEAADCSPGLGTCAPRTRSHAAHLTRGEMEGNTLGTLCPPTDSRYNAARTRLPACTNSTIPSSSERRQIPSAHRCHLGLPSALQALRRGANTKRVHPHAGGHGPGPARGGRPAPATTKGHPWHRVEAPGVVRGHEARAARLLPRHSNEAGGAALGGRRACAGHGRCHARRSHQEVGAESNVVGGVLRVGQVRAPCAEQLLLLGDRQHRKRRDVRRRVPHVVEAANVALGEVGVLWLLAKDGAVCRREEEGVAEGRGALHGEDGKAVLRQLVKGQDRAVAHASVPGQQLVHGRRGLRVEVAAQDDGARVLARHALLELAEQLVRLPQLDVLVLGVPEEVRVGHAEPHGLWQRRAGGGLVHLQHHDLGHVVVRESALDLLHAVQVRLGLDRVHALGLGGLPFTALLDRLVEVQVVLLQEAEPGGLEEHGAAIHLAGNPHGLAVLLPVEPLVPELVHLGKEEGRVVVSLHLLQADDVGVKGAQLLRDELLPVIEGKGPRRAVRVHAAVPVDLGQHVEGDDAHRVGLGAVAVGRHCGASWPAQLGVRVHGQVVPRPGGRRDGEGHDRLGVHHSQQVGPAHAGHVRRHFHAKAAEHVVRCGRVA